MNPPPQSMQQLGDLLQGLDGLPFNRYQVLEGQCFGDSGYQIRFIHIQGSLGAFPASVVHLVLEPSFLNLPKGCLANAQRKQATADYLIRTITDAVAKHCQPNRGSQGSGSFQPVTLPPQVLERNLVTFNAIETRIAIRISLPGSVNNRILGNQAVQMVTTELSEIILVLKQAVDHQEMLKLHCDRIEDMLALQKQLSRHGLVAFVGDGALLPRRSGVSQKPMRGGAVVFKAPNDLAVHVDLPHAGRIRGMGIREGVTVLIGGSFHGKSTLLEALAKAVYPHIPGDGREQVASHGKTAVVCTEPGRSVSGVDISGFMMQLPGNRNPGNFWTQNASGSTSQAASIAEAVTADAKLLLIDEDASATNFLIRDSQMRELIPDDPIIPLFDRVRELYENFGVSTLIVVGSSSAYLGVADHAIAMRNYLPHSMTQQVGALPLPKPVVPDQALIIEDRRRLQPDNFDPSYRAKRLGKAIAVRIKPVRLYEALLEYGNQQLDLTSLTALVDIHQVVAVGYALLLAKKRFIDKALSPSGLAVALSQLIDAEGLDALCIGTPTPLFLARPRQLELAGAINRLRNLKIAPNYQDT